MSGKPSLEEAVHAIRAILDYNSVDPDTRILWDRDWRLTTTHVKRLADVLYTPTHVTDTCAEPADAVYTFQLDTLELAIKRYCQSQGLSLEDPADEAAVYDAEIEEVR